MTNLTASLKGRWDELAAASIANCSVQSSDFCFQTIAAFYNHPNRYYHNLKHIKDCLILLDQCKGYLEKPFIVEFAIWFHDLIYDPRRKDNEVKSAEYAVNLLAELSLPNNDIGEIEKLILHTQHKEENLVGDCAYLVDIDLAILGSSSEDYRVYENQIKKEYQHLSDAEFSQGRVKVLQYFLNLPHIYNTPFFYKNYELQARLNIKNALVH